jgi:uncharacterized NAD-dependent epimerase/dehydratase family protein
VCALYEAVCTACGLFPPAKVVGIALNTRHLDDGQAREAMAQTEAETGLPVTDVVRYGSEPLVDAIMG